MVLLRFVDSSKNEVNCMDNFLTLSYSDDLLLPYFLTCNAYFLILINSCNAIFRCIYHFNKIVQYILILS